jgi:hypothetical protein
MSRAGPFMLWKVYLVRCSDDSLYCRTTIDSNGREKMDSEIVCIVVISKMVGLKDTGSKQLAESNLSTLKISRAT